MDDKTTKDLLAIEQNDQAQCLRGGVLGRFTEERNVQTAVTAASDAEGYRDEAKTLRDSINMDYDYIDTARENAEAAADESRGNADRTSADAQRAEEAANLAQQIAQGALGYYKTPELLREKHPEGKDGNWAVIGTTDTIWVWDSDTSSWTDSGNKTDLSQYYTKAEIDERMQTAIAFTVTLSTDGWKNGVQTVKDARFLTDDRYQFIVDCAGACISADDVTVEGQMTFHADILPAATLSINITRLEVLVNG